jgi:uncharacterized membrane protein YhhN
VKNNSWIITFLLVLAAHLIGIIFHNELVVYITKPMLIVSLAVYFIYETQTTSSPLRNWIAGALVFSWAGDVLLLFQPRSEHFFLFGLGAFLVAHIFYIIFFHDVRMKENLRSNLWFLLVVAVYYAALNIFLSPYLGDMRLPVRIYGIVISFMLMLALHMLFIRNKNAGRWLVIGALLFVISDSLLAINKFYKPFAMAGVSVMLTYGLAQLFIIHGAVDYIRSAHKE